MALTCIKVQAVHWQKEAGKLTEKTTWYKRKRQREEDGDDEEHGMESSNRKGGKRWKKDEKEEKKVKAVMFCPYTTNSRLALKLIESEDRLEVLTGYRLKVVERAGTKLVNLLHKSDPWQGIYCGRDLCLLCSTKARTGKLMKQECTKRSCIYEIWCIKCQEIEEEKN